MHTRQDPIPCRSATTVLVLAAALAACNGKNPTPTGGTGSGAAPGASSPSVAMTEHDHGKCVREDSKSANTCELDGNKLTCHVFVGMTKNNKPYVRPYNLLVEGGAINGKTVVVWHLVDADLEFLETHGPSAWNKPTQFEQGKLTNDADGEPPSGVLTAARRYRIDYKNNAPAPKSDPHRYVIRFKQGNKVHKCDPIIINADAG